MTVQHDKLINRELPNQHPKAAITGLTEELDGKLGVDHLTQENPHPQYFLRGDNESGQFLVVNGNSVQIRTGISLDATSQSLQWNDEGGISIK